MKTKILICGLLILWMGSIVSAQSDYETLMSFKKEYNKIETSIKNVSSLEELNSIKEEILNLKNEFASNRVLLDKALYPENFQSSFDKIENVYENKERDFSQIASLTAQVGSLQSQLTDLSNRNEKLIKQINELLTKSEKDKTEITELKRLVAQLRGNIKQRDLLVRDLVDSLLVEFNKMPENINQKEARSIISKVNKGNLFYNIERTIDDNIQFLKVTRMSADDFGKAIKQYQDFNKVWKQIGSRLSKVYLTKKQKRSEISMIDSLFTGWNSQIQTSLWNTLQDLFGEKNINLKTFHDAHGFVTSAINFIDEEIANPGNKNKTESELIFHTFTDSVYFKSVENKWMPLLIENHFLTENDKDLLDAKIAMWKKEFVPVIPFWAYVIGGILILFVAVYFYQNRQRPLRSIK